MGLRELDEHVGEMKRLYVPAEFQGLGIGKALMHAFIEHAKSLGYTSIRLDTVSSLDKAIKLYKAFGFTEIPPYRHNPFPDAIFMERKIT